MPYCRNCGTEIPDDAKFCPSCGATIEARTPATPEAAETVFRYVIIGLLGGFLSVMITIFSGETDLVFIPSFVASIIVIFVYRIGELKDSLIASLMIYLFAEGILLTLELGFIYASGTPYKIELLPTIWEVALYSFTPVSAILAAYIGVKMGPKKKEQMVRPPRRREGPGGVIYSV